MPSRISDEFSRLERRGKSRSRLVVQVDCRGNAAACVGKTVDISETGLLISTTDQLDVGESVKVRFALPVEHNAITIEATGIVVRLVPGKEPLMGIKFSILPDEQRAAIRRFIESQQ